MPAPDLVTAELTLTGRITTASNATFLGSIGGAAVVYTLAENKLANARAITSGKSDLSSYDLALMSVFAVRACVHDEVGARNFGNEALARITQWYTDGIHRDDPETVLALTKLIDILESELEKTSLDAASIRQCEKLRYQAHTGFGEEANI